MDDLDRFAARLRAAILAGDGPRITADLETLVATVRQLRRELAAERAAYEASVAALAAELNAARAEIARLREACEAARGVMWMVERYAEAGGRYGAEMADYTDAMNAIRRALGGGEEKSE